MNFFPICRTKFDVFVIQKNRIVYALAIRRYMTCFSLLWFMAIADKWEHNCVCQASKTMFDSGKWEKVHSWKKAIWNINNKRRPNTCMNVHTALCIALWSHWSHSFFSLSLAAIPALSWFIIQPRVGKKCTHSSVMFIFIEFL